VAAIATAAAPGGSRRGSVAWSQRLGPGSAPVEAAGIGPELVTIARGRDLVALEAATGAIRWQRPLRTLASSSAVPSAGWVYAPLDAGGMQRFPEDPQAAAVAAQQPAADGTPAARPEPATNSSSARPQPDEPLAVIEISSDGEVDFAPRPYQGGIVWCTTAGRMAALIRSPAGSQRLDFDLGGPAAGPPVVHNGDIFVATKAGDIARIARSPRGLTANSGVMVMKDPDDKEVTVPFVGWHTVIDEVPEGSPLVGGNTVVISLGPAGIAAFAADTGDLLWQEPALGQPIAITGEQVWCLEATGFLVARDLATGARAGRLCLGCFTIPIVNTTSERLVLASPGGLVVSLAPRRTVAAEPPVPQRPVPLGPQPPAE